jgi:hypothetical protein
MSAGLRDFRADELLCVAGPLWEGMAVQLDDAG